MIKVINDNFPYVTGVEIYNSRHSHNRDAYITAKLHEIIRNINQNGATKGVCITAKHSECFSLAEKIKEFRDFRISIFYGSNTTAHEAIRPGFYSTKEAKSVDSKLNKRNLKLITSNGLQWFSRIINRPPDTKIYQHHFYKTCKTGSNKRQLHPIHTLAFLKEFSHRGFYSKFFQLLDNPHPLCKMIKKTYFGIKAPIKWIRNSLTAMAGILPLLIFPSVNLEHILVFYGITFTRNILVDQLSHSKAFRPFTYNIESRWFEWKWKLSYIDWSNTTNSLFWTGWSIAMLQGVEDLVHNLVKEVDGEPLLLAKGVFFMAMSVANFMYIFMHTYFFRGMEFAIAVNSAMRTIYSVPFSTLTGTFLFPVHENLFIQNKVWTDTTAGLIEGFGKMKNVRGERLFDFTSLLDKALEAEKVQDRRKLDETLLNIIHIFSTQPRGKETLQNLLFSEEKYKSLVAESKLRAYQGFAQKLLSKATPDLLSILEEKSLDKRSIEKLSVILEREIDIFKKFLSRNLSRTNQHV